MKDQTVLVKRSIAEHGLPKKHRIFFAIDKDGHETTCNRVFMECNPNAIKFYYESVPLSSLIESRMPTDNTLDFFEWLSKQGYRKVHHIHGDFLWRMNDGSVGVTTERLYNKYLKTQLTSKP